MIQMTPRHWWGEDVVTVHCPACQRAPVKVFVYIGDPSTWLSWDKEWCELIPNVSAREFQRCWKHSPCRPGRGVLKGPPVWSPIEASRADLAR